MRIDWWTLALQTVNVLILIWILSRFLFRPVVAIIEERRAAAAKLLTDAEAEKTRAIAARKAAEAEAASIAAGRDATLRQAAADGEAQRATALASARAEVEQLRAAAEAEMRGARAAGAAAASDRAAELAVDIAGKLIARLPDSARVDGFIDGLAEGAGLAPRVEPGRDRRDGQAAADRAARADRRRRLNRAATPSPERSAGRSTSPSRRTRISSPGSSSRPPHAVVRNSLRSDLNRIVEELTRHDRVQH